MSANNNNKAGKQIFPLPNQQNYEYGHKLALKLVGERLTKIDNIEQQCRKSGARYQVMDSQKTVTLEYLNQSYQITLPDIDVLLTGSKEKVPIREKILILHYFTRARGTPLTNHTIAYKELPEGTTYFPTFYKRAIKPLLDHFGQDPEPLTDAAQRLGGNRADYGDVAVTINAFKYVPITLVLWRGDKEFEPEGNILFDSTIPGYLSIEDINVLCETISWKLVRYLREIQGHTG